MERRKKTKLTATQSLVLGVVVVIFIGAIILKLPISNNEGRSIKFLDSLFVSTSCVCVTGLTTVVPSEQFSKFGQIVLMCLIEIGGLGFMSFIALILMFMGRKINLSDRMLIKESLNQNNVGGLIKLIKKIFLYTITFQIVGMLLLSIRFIPKYGVGEGLFYSFMGSDDASKMYMMKDVNSVFGMLWGSKSDIEDLLTTGNVAKDYFTYGNTGETKRIIINDNYDRALMKNITGSDIQKIIFFNTLSCYFCLS